MFTVYSGQTFTVYSGQTFTVYSGQTFTVHSGQMFTVFVMVIINDKCVECHFMRGEEGGGGVAHPIDSTKRM